MSRPLKDIEFRYDIDVKLLYSPKLTKKIPNNTSETFTCKGRGANLSAQIFFIVPLPYHNYPLKKELPHKKAPPISTDSAFFVTIKSYLILFLQGDTLVFHRSDLQELR